MVCHFACYLGALSFCMFLGGLTFCVLFGWFVILCISLVVLHDIWMDCDFGCKSDGLSFCVILWWFAILRVIWVICLCACYLSSLSICYFGGFFI